MRRVFAVLAWTLALLVCVPMGAQAASTWNKAGAQKLEPEPMEGDFQFAAVGTDGTDIAGWNHYTVGTTFDNQALTIAPRGKAFPPGVNVSPDAYYYNDQRWSANTHGDVGFAYAYGDPDDDTESTTVYGVGTRAAGSGIARRIELDRQVTGKAENSQATHTVAIDVGANGDVVVAYLGKGLSVWAAVGKAGGSFTRPVQLSQRGHNASDEVALSVAIDQTGQAFVAWRDVKGDFPFTGPEPRGTIVYAQGANGSWSPPRALTPANEDVHRPLSMGRNDAGDMIIAWSTGAAYRRRGGAVGSQERHGLQSPDQAAVDPDGVAYIAGLDQSSKEAILVAARPVNGRFLAAQSIALGGEPHFILQAPGRGAAFVAATGYKPLAPHPVTVRLIAANGRTGAPIAAVTPDRPVNRVAFDVRPTDGAALLVYGLEAGGPYSQLYAERGTVDLRAPERSVAQLVTPARGSVPYRVAGLSKFGTLGGRGLVPDRSEIDANGHDLDLTVSRGGQRETVSLSGSRFVTKQVGSRSAPTTELRLSSFSCATSSARGSRASTSARRRKQRLFGHGKGHYTTRGHWGSGTVRGTTWTTEDTCDYTKISVTTGVVSVRDFVRGRTVSVSAGHSYTAKRR